MPLIQIRVLEGILTTEQKNEMISRVSNVVAEIEAGPEAKDKLLPYTWCLIEEVSPAKWGVGGNPLNLDIFRSLLAG